MTCSASSWAKRSSRAANSSKSMPWKRGTWTFEEPRRRAMRRRDLFKVVGATICAAFGPCVRGAGRDRRPWKTAIGLNGFASASRKYGKSFPIRDVLHFAASHGFDGVELTRGWPAGPYPRADQRERIAALERLYDGFGLQVFSIQTGAGGAFAPDPAARGKWIEQFRDQARFAKAVGAECIGMWPGGPLRGQSIDEAIERLAESFRRAAAIAAQLGLVAAFEIEPPFVFHTEEHLRRILQGANHPALKAIYDPSHFDLMNGSTGRPHEMLGRVGVENIGYVHLTDTDGTLRDGGTSKHLPCGDGHVDIAASLKTLWEGGFRGWIMIDAWEIPDPYEACAKGKKAIDQALARLG
ncbi:MAG TPA: sugar phosphate isomerase/epimerase [Planctomycetaceae bacterium]|nr:sugar phosphate isomerase/epimerase [Planctomycetaceae bacterium]